MTAALGLGLLASGIKGLKGNTRELIIGSVSIPTGKLILQIIEEIFKITTLTANFAVLLLQYLGFRISPGVPIYFSPNGSVSVAAFLHWH